MALGTGRALGQVGEPRCVAGTFWSMGILLTPNQAFKLLGGVSLNACGQLLNLILFK